MRARPVVNVQRARLAVPIYGAEPAACWGFNNIELITDRPLEVNLRRVKAVKRGLPRPVRMIASINGPPCEEEAWKAIAAACGRHRCRRDRAETLAARSGDGRTHRQWGSLPWGRGARNTIEMVTLVQKCTRGCR